MKKSEKEIAINNHYLNGYCKVDVSKVDGVCNEFTGNLTNEGIKTDTDGSKYVTVTDLEGNFFDVGIDRIDFAAHEKVNLLEHAVINQLEANFNDQDFDSMLVTIGLLLKNEEAKKILIEYLGDKAKENWLEGRTNVRY
jgi:hypothetical protein